MCRDSRKTVSELTWVTGCPAGVGDSASELSPELPTQEPLSAAAVGLAGCKHGPHRAAWELAGRLMGQGAPWSVQI